MLKVISVALGEVGYLEKETNAQLDNKTSNAGDENYTKYARDLYKVTGFYNGNKNGFAWCDVFVDWCFVQAYGVELAKKLLNHGQLGAGVNYSAQYYKDAGRWHTSPQVGDQIFFKTSKSAWAHTGLVVEVNADTIVTVEGNTSGASGVIANGGGVCKKTYKLGSSSIVGYGRPDYSLTEGKGSANMLTIKEAFLTRNPYYQLAEKITVAKLLLHSVGCAQPNASVFLKNWNKETYKRACIHAFIDANNGTVYQTMPWEWRAPHSGGVWLNSNSIGVEMCESSHIKYIGQTDRFNIINREAALAHAKTTYMAAVELFAYLCLRFSLDPFEDILSHNEGGKQNIASDHSDPEHYWDQLGTGYTMKGFRQDVANAMEGKPTVTIVEKKEEEKQMASTYNFPILRKGNKGSYVKALQKMLEASGYSCGKAGIDGDFGNGTETALMDFQDDHGLVPDGVVGAATWPVVIAAPNMVGDKALREKYNTLQASADAFRTRVKNALDTYDKGKA